MNRLTTDTPAGNLETMLNFVYGKDGWAHIRHDGEEGAVPLTQWAKAQCILHGCGEFSAETPQEIDDAICGCMMEFPDCPFALAYCFASQAVHLRSRLKMYEDILFTEDGTELLTLDGLQKAVKPNDPLALDQLREMDGEPVWVTSTNNGRGRSWALVDRKYEVCREVHGGLAVFENYGKTWLAYRRKPEEATT